MKKLGEQNNLFIYKNKDGSIVIDTIYKDETSWLTQKGIAKVFDVGVLPISKNLKNIFDKEELDASVVVFKMENTSQHGTIYKKELNNMELIDVFDENNKYLGYSVERSKVHKDNLWHRHVSAWIMNYNGEILLQQRSFDKKKNPGKWAKTGGHVDAGETCEESIKREVYEEIGLKVNDDEIKNIEIFKSINPNEHYYLYGYIFFTNYKEDDFILQKEEVNAVRYYSIEEFEEIRKKDDKNYTFCNWDEEGFMKQINLLKKYRDSIIKQRS